MSDDLVKRIKDRGDWLVDAVATATQNRMFLRGEPECDDVACDVIRMNGEKAMSQIAKPLAYRIEELEKACKEWAEVSQSNYQRAKVAEAKLAVVVEALEFIALNFNKPDRGLTDFGERQHYLFVACRLRDKARTTLAEIKGEQP